MQKLPENIAMGMLKTAGVAVEQMSKVSSYIEQAAAFVCVEETPWPMYPASLKDFVI